MKYTISKAILTLQETKDLHDNMVEMRNDRADLGLDKRPDLEQEITRLAKKIKKVRSEGKQFHHIEDRVADYRDRIDFLHKEEDRILASDFSEDEIRERNRIQIDIADYRKRIENLVNNRPELGRRKTTYALINTSR